MLDRGAPWMLAFGGSGCSNADPCNAENQVLVEALVREWSVAALGVFPQCSSFSAVITARAPPVRSSTFVAGKPHVSPAILEKIRSENKVNTWCARLLRECLKPSVRFWVGSPSSSFWWKQRSLQKLLKLSKGSQSSLLSACMFDLCHAGAPWTQRTLVLTNLVCLAACFAVETIATKS